MPKSINWEEKTPNERIAPSHWEGYHLRELTIGNVLRQQAKKRGGAIYLQDLGADRSYSFAEVDATTERMAANLLALGLKQYDHVGVMLDNSVDCLFTHFALGKIGAVSVPITTAQRGASLTHILKSAEIVAVIAEGASVKTLLDAAADTPALRLLINRGPVEDAGANANITRADFSALQRETSGPVNVEVRFSDPAFIMFTSGTTGAAKGNVFVHATTLMWEQSAPRLWNVTPDDIYYFCVSMSHAAGLFGITYLMAAVGGGVALSSRFSATSFIDEARRSGATMAMLLGAMANFVENTPERPDDRDNKLRLMLTGPMPKDPAKLMQRFNTELSQGYGLTDHSSFAKLPLGVPVEKLASVGKIVEPYEVQIVDDDDLPVPIGSKGEILVRSRYPWRNSSGYYARPADSMAARRNDWFHTGDLGHFDEEGYLYFVDRKKDAIRRRGENISAFEVERVVLRHPAVAEAAVYAIKSDLSEDEVCVSLVAREDAQLDLPNLIRFCIANMPAYMIPRFVHVSEQLPKTITQRVEKYKLRQWADENRAELWDRETLDEFKRIK
jgi:crotonobetaine/carnitine-CoA ligase